MTVKKNIIAIVGFGATGLSFFTNLMIGLNKNSNIKEIFIISPQEFFIGGMAFTAPDKNHLLNTPASLMSCYIDNPLHFVDWLKSKNINDNFPARNIFKQYLVEQYKYLLELAHRYNIKIKEFFTYATQIRRLNCKKFEIYLEDKKVLVVDKVVYTPGQQVNSNIQIFNKVKNVINFQSQTTNFKENFQNIKKIAILGSGLTAIDAIVSLYNVQEIHIYSRSGLLPSINCINPIYKSSRLNYKYFTHENLKKCFNGKSFNFIKFLYYLFKELKQYPINELTVGLKYLKQLDFNKFYKVIIPLAQNNCLPVYSLLASTRNYWSLLWNSISISEKKSFQKYSRIWNIFRHPIPIKNAIKVQFLLENNRLFIHKLDKMIVDKNKLLLKSNKIIDEYDLIIDASSKSSSFINSTSKFDKSLLKNNLVKIHEAGGISVCDKSLSASPNFFIAGELLCGHFHLTNAFWFNQQLTKKIADFINQ